MPFLKQERPIVGENSKHCKFLNMKTISIALKASVFLPSNVIN